MQKTKTKKNIGLTNPRRGQAKLNLHEVISLF